MFSSCLCPTCSSQPSMPSTTLLKTNRMPQMLHSPASYWSASSYLPFSWSFSRWNWALRTNRQRTINNKVGKLRLIIGTRIAGSTSATMTACHPGQSWLSTTSRFLWLSCFSFVFSAQWFKGDSSDSILCWYWQTLSLSFCFCLSLGRLIQRERWPKRSFSKFTGLLSTYWCVYMHLNSTKTCTQGPCKQESSQWSWFW